VVFKAVASGTGREDEENTIKNSLPGRPSDNGHFQAHEGDGRIILK
jgi:hypothetical protein